jgi:hypothetical protein
MVQLLGVKKVEVDPSMALWAAPSSFVLPTVEDCIAAFPTATLMTVVGANGDDRDNGIQVKLNIIQFEKVRMFVHDFSLQMKLDAESKSVYGA